MGDDSDTTASFFSTLLCQEDETCLMNQVENDDEELEKSSIDFHPFVFSEDDDEYIENLVQRESYCFGSKGFVPFSHCSSTSWFKAARLDSIDWIFNACSSSSSESLICFLFLFDSISESFVRLLSSFRQGQNLGSGCKQHIYPSHTLIGFFRNDPLM